MAVKKPVVSKKSKPKTTVSKAPKKTTAKKTVKKSVTKKADKKVIDSIKKEKISLSATFFKYFFIPLCYVLLHMLSLFGVNVKDFDSCSDLLNENMSDVVNGNTNIYKNNIILSLAGVNDSAYYNNSLIGGSPENYILSEMKR